MTNEEREDKGARSGPYQLFMLVLCVFALAALAIEAFAPLKPETRRVLDLADFGVCLFFLVDFVYSLATARNRVRYLVTWGWVDLLSSVPVVGAARLGRLARVLRILRLLRGVRATKILASYILDKRSQSMFLAAALVTILLVVCASVGILEVEKGTFGANIESAEDALWWSLGTLTTVGFNDRFPVTAEGRAIGIVLMAAGVGLFGLFSGFVASWFLAPREKQEVADLQEIKREMAALRKLLEERK
jgi:voltage-gated potassium channel